MRWCVCEGVCYSTQGGFCNASSSSVMTCLVPNTTSDLTSNISYTVRFGSAPGPDLTSVELTLDLRPNPVFAEDGSALVDNDLSDNDRLNLTVCVGPYKMFLKKIISLLYYVPQGANLASVDRSQIRVLVGESECHERSSDSDNMDTTVS